MTISSVSSTTTSTTSTSSTSSTSSLANTQTFLTLLLKQLEVQDPTNPVDTSTYVSQLVSLASLEQQISVGDKLDTISSQLTSLGTGTASLGYLGKTVSADGDTTALQDGSANWTYDLGSDASSVTLTVTDSSGNTVYTQSGDTSSGSHSFSWDGTGTNGKTYSSGTYTLSVSATDSSGDAVDVDTTISGKVTSIDNSSGTTMLSIGGVSVDASSILSLS